MKKINRVLWTALIVCAVFVKSEALSFTPEDGVRAEITVLGNVVDVYTNDGSSERRQRLEIETEKPIQVKIDDYLFNGRLGFALKYIDEGMGVFTLYRVFVYTETNGFEEIFPRCGDEFINLKINKRKKILVSTYFQDQKPIMCITKPKRST